MTRTGPRRYRHHRRPGQLLLLQHHRRPVGRITAALWADAVIDRLEGLAIFLLGGELAEIADRARAAARRPADRIGDLGGAITADSRQLLDRPAGAMRVSTPGFLSGILEMANPGR